MRSWFNAPVASNRLALQGERSLDGYMIRHLSCLIMHHHPWPVRETRSTKVSLRVGGGRSDPPRLEIGEPQGVATRRG